MGLFDFLRKDMPIRERKSVKTFDLGNGHTFTSTASARLEVVPDDDAADYPEPPDTLRDLKTYAENVAHPCGFDFSSVRRHKSTRGEWWLEGDNYRKAMEALRSLRKFEDDARSRGIGFPRAVDYIAKKSMQYNVGNDGNRVPIIEVESTKKRGTCIRAVFHICLSSGTPLSSASIFFDDDGSVKEASVMYFEKRGSDRWGLSVEIDKSSGLLALSSVTKNYQELYNERIMARQRAHEEKVLEKLAPFSTMDGITSKAKADLDMAGYTDRQSRDAVRSLDDSRGWSRRVERDGDSMTLTCERGGDGGLMRYTTDGDYSRMRYWQKRGAPQIDFEISKGKLTRKKFNGKSMV